MSKLNEVFSADQIASGFILRLERSILKYGWMLHILAPSRTGDHRRIVVVNAEVKEVGPGEKAGPAMMVDEDHVQQLMDDLWQGGVRPSNGVASTGQLEAIQAHLDSMKEVAGHWRELGKGFAERILAGPPILIPNDTK